MVYKKNFLSDVIFKINFPVVLTLVDESPKKFQETIIQDFPVLEPSHKLEFKIENKGIDIVAQKGSRLLWKFQTKDKLNSIELDYESLALICKGYKDYKSFKSVIVKILRVFYEIYPEVVINRLGVRYINQVKLNEKEFFNWKNYLDANLIAHLNFIKDKKQVKRVLNTFDLSCDEDTSLIFKYGIFNETYPGKVTKKEFLLDYDCYTAIQFEKEKVEEKVDYFHTIIKAYFERSIEDKFREVLNNE